MALATLVVMGMISFYMSSQSIWMAGSTQAWPSATAPCWSRPSRTACARARAGQVIDSPDSLHQGLILYATRTAPRLLALLVGRERLARPPGPGPRTRTAAGRRLAGDALPARHAHALVADPPGRAARRRRASSCAWPRPRRSTTAGPSRHDPRDRARVRRGRLRPRRRRHLRAGAHDHRRSRSSACRATRRSSSSARSTREQAFQSAVGGIERAKFALACRRSSSRA